MDVGDEMKDTLQDEKDGSDDGSIDTGEGEEGDGQYAKVAMTPEEVALAKEATRNMRKANKKAVKEANCEKRKVKIKKKDKKRAVNKTRGNKKK